MQKTAALHKLAGAVRSYVAAEQDYMKVVNSAHGYQMQKMARGNAGALARLQNLFRAAPPPPVPAGMTGAQALLAALGVGGAALATPHIAAALGEMGAPEPAALGPASVHPIVDLLNAPQALVGRAAAGIGGLAPLLPAELELARAQAGQQVISALQGLVAPGF